MRRTSADEDGLTLSKIGKKFGLSRERVRQIEVILKRQFSEYLKEKFGPKVFEEMFR